MTDLERYIELRRRAECPEGELHKQISHTLQDIRVKEEALFRCAQRSYMANQSYLRYCARVRETAILGFQRLCQQPWLLSLEQGPDTAILIAAQTSGQDQRLALAVNLLAEDTVSLVSPPARNGWDNRLFKGALRNLALGGLFVELVEVAAAHLGMELARTPGHAQRVDFDVSTRYYDQHLDLLMRDLASIVGQTESTQRLECELTTLYQRLVALETQGRDARGHQMELVEKWKNDYDRICRTPRVRSVHVEDAKLIVYTEDIVCNGVAVGQFKIVINYGAGMLTVTNETRPYLSGGTRYDHPHIRNGQCCLGNIERPVREMLASRDPKLVPLLIRFLESYNGHSPYRDLDNWRGRTQSND